jgi:hypothetical protein
MGADGLQDEGWLRARLVSDRVQIIFRVPDSPVGARRYANIEGLSPWTKDKLSPEEYLRKEVVELNNGRLAMLACIGLWAQELVQHGQPVMFTLLEKVATYEIPALFQEFHQ